MKVKIVIISLLFFTTSACTNTSINTQASIDTRACNALSYGNKNLNEHSIDEVYKTCMNNKKKARDRQSEYDRNSAIFDFLFNVFLPSDKSN